MTTGTSVRRTDGRARVEADLLAAAREAFAERGVGTTKVAHIAARAHVATGTFYKHFATKQAILDAVVAREAEEQVRSLADALAGTEDSARALGAAHRHFLRLTGIDPQTASLLLRLERLHDLGTAVFRETMLPRMQEGIDQRRLRIYDAELALRATCASLFAVMDGLLREEFDDKAELQHIESTLRSVGLKRREAVELARAGADESPI